MTMRVHMCHTKRPPYLMDSAGDIINHPPYSPDVAPSDYHLFPALKHLGGRKFKLDEEVQKAVVSWLRGAAGEFYDAGIKKLVTRMRKVIERQGNYVKK